MTARFFSILPAIAAVAFLGFGVVRADEGKDQKAPEAKKDCDGSGCKDDKAAKKDDCEDGCCSKPAAKVSAKQMECADCEKAGAPCDKCKTALKEGTVAVIPVKGMMCGSCENGVGKKLDGLEQVAKFMVSSKHNVAVVVVAPGKMLMTSVVKGALEGTQFSIDEEAPLAGRVSFSLDCSACGSCEMGKAEKSGKKCDMCPEDAKAEKKADKKCDMCPDEAKKDDKKCEMKGEGEQCMKALCDELAKLQGVEKVSQTSCEGATKIPFVTLQLAEGSKVTMKQLRDTVVASKKKIGDFVFFGAKTDECKDCGKKSSP